MVSEVTRAQSEDLLIDNLDAERLSRANYAFDDVLKGGIPHFEALVLGFHLGDLVHRPHSHHPCCLVAFTHQHQNPRHESGRQGRDKSISRHGKVWLKRNRSGVMCVRWCRGIFVLEGTAERLKRGWRLLRAVKVEIHNSLF